MEPPGNNISPNPYQRPLHQTWQQLRRADWSAPYIPQISLYTILIAITLIYVALYCTVGISSQISSTFLNQMRESNRQARTASGAERTAYAIAAGVYATVALPFIVLQVPFWIIGKLFQHQSIAIILFLCTAAIAILAIATLGLTDPDTLTTFAITTEHKIQSIINGFAP